MKIVWSVAAFILSAVPGAVHADGLVPCGDVGEDYCTPCHVVQLIDNVFDWLVNIAFIVCALIIVVAGLRLASSVGNVSVKTESRKRITTALLSFVIIFMAWFFIDLVLKVLVGTGTDLMVGPWNALQCVSNPIPS